MKYGLKKYQREAVDKIKRRINLLLEENSKGTIVFKSPTGSGKTFMLSSLFEEIAQENETSKFCVVWCCPGKGDLHKQSFNNAKEYLGGNPVCSLLEDEFFGSRPFIKNKEIVFVNWEKLVNKDSETGEWKNNLMKDQEGANFINVLDNTRNNGLTIILLVDESHIGASQRDRITEFRDTILIPQITIEMSATPLSEHIDVEVDPQDVIDEGMIKEDVIVNEGISKEDRSLEDKESEILVLEKGYEKRLELKKRYEELGAIVNPLVLIQIPNKDAGEDKKLVIKDFLREKGITEENGKLKLWCDDYASFDKKAIRKNDDVTEFLIFKTAVATGWDCPRAHVLVKFRDGKSETFEIQTIGRILRTAEAKSYDDSLLDNAYIFTNIKDFETKKDTYNPNRIKTEISYMRKPYTKLRVWAETQLKSFYRSREGDYNSADSRFSEYYEIEFMKFFEFVNDDKYLPWINNQPKFIAKGCNMSIDTHDEILEETAIKSSSVDKEQKVINETATVKMSGNDIRAKYYSIIRRNLNGLAAVRSESPINTAIVNAFDKFYAGAFTRSDKIDSYQRIVVNNEELFSEILSSATAEFRKMLGENMGKKPERYDFKIEDKRAYSKETHKKIDAPKSLYQPLFVAMESSSGDINELEKEFLDYLGESGAVDWFWENGPEIMRINFGIGYNNDMNTFQPDFIVRFKDGRIGIFDTKGIGQRVEETTVKAEALHKYLININQNRGDAPEVIGGIVVKSGSRFYWYDQLEYHDYGESRDNWIDFNGIIREVHRNMENQNYMKKLSEYLDNFNISDE